MRSAADDKESQIRIRSLFGFLRNQVDNKSSLFGKMAHLSEVALAEGFSYYDYKKKLYEVESGREQHILELIRQHENNSSFHPGHLMEADFRLRSENFVGTS